MLGSVRSTSCDNSSSHPVGGGGGGGGGDPLAALEALLRSGDAVDLDRPDAKQGFTPLGLAAAAGRLEALKALTPFTLTPLP